MDSVVIEGPLFDGKAEAAMHAYSIKARDHIADVAERRIKERLDHVLKHPTGHYRDHIHQEDHDPDKVITDTPVVYGPWLEGVGSRNFTTRFKGYRTFRIIGQEIEAEAKQLAEEVLPPYLEAMR